MSVGASFTQPACPAEETKAVAVRGTVIGLCPITEANLGDGIFQGRGFSDHGGRFGIGPDSNVRIDVTEELRFLEYRQRLDDRARNCLADGAGASTGSGLFAGALAEGSQVLGCTGGVAVNNHADLVSIDIEHPSLYGKPAARILDALVFSSGRSAIDCVWRADNKVVQAGIHINRQKIMNRYKRAYASLAL